MSKIVKYSQKIIVPNKLPFLEKICWQTNNVYAFSAQDMLSRYEREWRFYNLYDLEGEELQFLKQIAAKYKSWLSPVLARPIIQQAEIKEIIDLLNPNLFKKYYIYFCGGSLINLQFGQYRSNKDLNFIFPFLPNNQREIRKLIYEKGFNIFFRKKVKIYRPMTNQYKIILGLEYKNKILKIDVSLENLVDLDPPIYLKNCPVPCLNLNDTFTRKLLANCDRYQARTNLYEDLIDLAILRSKNKLPESAIDKAQKIYSTTKKCLQLAINNFKAKANPKTKYYSFLKIAPGWIPNIERGLELLESDLNKN